MAYHPILWTFRRCPYAIRARLALASSRVTVELREILLRDKPEAFLQTSPSGTVPTLQLPDKVIDESLEIMVWALQQNDPQRLLDMPQEGWGLITVNDGPFKAALDHTKYTTRHPDLDPKEERRKAARYLLSLDERLVGQAWLFGDRPTLADLALLPFVRQFAHIDRAWFDAQEWQSLTAWLDQFLDSEVFLLVMRRYATWSEDDAPNWFNG
ncbi:glutathione S-transferase [Ruegeria sp. A3M17]|uniref:glutathione S-transferase n=1 Tax=Ruegeria sp. A3M17 TaxID=2267229 RepID=UPI000DE870F8|nr:glutathione S-transferase [Ruegeria sp. A3M17]RBW52547.1 glutathione S-transferase [Ruegeria sp. A3M17]